MSYTTLKQDSMLSQLNGFFDQEGFIPHGHCYLWMPEVLWLHLITDAIIALAYLSIAIGLIYFLKRRIDLAYKSAFAMFGLFIMLCGFTHGLNIVTESGRPYIGLKACSKRLLPWRQLSLRACYGC